MRRTSNPVRARCSAQLRAAVASDLSAEHGVVAGENFQRRNVDQDLSPGPQHPIHLIERLSLDLVLERVQHVERGDQVELAGRKRQARGGRASDTALAAFARVREAAPGEVDAPGPSELPEHLQVMAGAASAVEDPRRLDASVAWTSNGWTKRRNPWNQKWSRSARAVASSRRSINGEF